VKCEAAEVPVSRLALFVDIEPGHVLPTYELAGRARAHGHSVMYFAPADVAESIRQQGFQVVEVLTSQLPLGSADELRRQAGSDPDRMLELALERLLPALADGTGIGKAMARFDPELLLISSLYQVEALALHLRHEVPIVFFTTNVPLHASREACRIDLSRLFEMRSATDEMVTLIRTSLPHVHTLDQLVDVLTPLPNLVMIPKALGVPADALGSNVFYFGSSVSRRRVEAPVQLHSIPSDKPLVYCSLGSQSHLRWPIRKRFFETVLSAASHRPRYHIVLSVGPQIDPATFGRIPSNVSLFSWVPQLTILKRAALMITHAGLGTVKECILNAVPMLAFPLGRDQFASAARVADRGIGITGDIESITSAELADLLDRALTDHNLRDRVTQMRKAVLDEDAAGEAIDFVPVLLKMYRRTRTPSSMPMSSAARF